MQTRVKEYTCKENEMNELELKITFEVFIEGYEEEEINHFLIRGNEIELIRETWGRRTNIFKVLYVDGEEPVFEYLTLVFEKIADGVEKKRTKVHNTFWKIVNKDYKGIRLKNSIRMV